ncbi:DUF1918 domain-containing protein [Kitasatospora sp. NPDC052896]|uniref:DUF1918 domain-containing protein n=1 Tax=Kitasatospora sp. NPDC052896 TaxID=3364061 RepID=UPI0037CB9487
MQAMVGDTIHIHSKAVGMADQLGEIIEVRGSHGEPPYLVRFEDGHDGLIYPGPDTVIEPHRQDRLW